MLVIKSNHREWAATRHPGIERRQRNARMSAYSSMFR